MIEDRTRWNKKYSDNDCPTEASEIVRKYYPLAPGTQTLDIAAGSGRNSIFLAERGFRVDAVDISEVGLRLFPEGFPGIQAICADLDAFEIPAGRYDLILNVLYLNRRLFPQIIEGLKPGGLLIFETLLKTDAAEGQGEHRRDYYLLENELLHSFLHLHVLHYHETPEAGRNGRKALASLVGIRK